CDRRPPYGPRRRRPGGARLGGEDDGRARAAVRAELERSAQLVPDERTDDRQPGALRAGAVDPGAVVGDCELDLVAAARQLDADARAPVLERVLQELGED